MKTQDKDTATPPKDIRNYVFGVILIALFLLVCRVFAPFFSVFLWAILFYVVFSPLHARIIKKIDRNHLKGRLLLDVWAGIFAVGTAIIILIPIFFVAFQFMAQIIDLTKRIGDEFNSRNDLIKDVLAQISTFITDISGGHVNISAEELQRQAVVLLNSSLQSVIQLSGSIAGNIGSFFLSMFLMIFCLFFFYTDGRYLSQLVLKAIPIKREYIATLTDKFMEITRNLFFGYIIVALLQSILAYLIFLVFSVEGALVFASLTFICVFIPIGGGAIVYLPLSLTFFVDGDILGGILFIATSFVFISSVDNFVRPVFLQNRIRLHPLIIFFAIMGGLRVFGFNGLILGPMVVIIFLTVLDLFLSEHHINSGK
ncbi:AI-2E family transporter [Breznakiellaceae bacterium SP9]